MRRLSLLGLVGVVACVSSVQAQSVSCETATNVDVYEFSGATQFFQFPSLAAGQGYAPTVRIEAFGAQGATGSLGTNNAPGGLGGFGGFVSADLPFPGVGTPVLVSVGGQGAIPLGGFNGGGEGGSLTAGGGGGASDVRIGSLSLDSRVVVAGGGGGGGRGGCVPGTVAGGAGGAGGGGAGSNGSDAPTSGGVAGGGRGASTTGAGAAGIGCSGFLGASGLAPVGAVGGKGGAGPVCCCPSVPAGGGGGGGFLPGFGGGGGSAGTAGCSGNDKGGGGGGAGGTSFAPGALSAVSLPGVKAGNGLIKICYSVVTLTPTPTPSPTPAPTIVPASVLRFQALLSSAGSEKISAPTVTPQSASPDAVTIRVCGRSSQLRNARERFSAVVQRVNGRATVVQGRVTSKAPCLVATVAQREVFRAFLRKSVTGKGTENSKSNFFAIQ